MLEIPLTPSLFHEQQGISLEGDHSFKNLFIGIGGFCNFIQFVFAKLDCV
jgi:hypothetical protein